MDKTCRNKVCDGQSVKHLFLSQDSWHRHHVAEKQAHTNSLKWVTSLMRTNHLSNNCPSQQERGQFNVHHNLHHNFSNL